MIAANMRPADLWPLPSAYHAKFLLVIYDGVTRATRIAKLIPGTLIRVEIVGNLPAPCGQLPVIGDYLP